MDVYAQIDMHVDMKQIDMHVEYEVDRYGYRCTYRYDVDVYR